MAYPVAVSPAGGRRTWTVLGEDYATVNPVEEWIEAHRHLWSPNTVRGYATSLAQWWSFLEQRGQTEGWREVGVPAFTAFLSWLRNGRTVEHRLAESEQPPTAATLEVRLAALISFYRWHQAVSGVAVAGQLLRGTPRHRPARGLLAHLDARSSPAASSLVRVRRDRRRDRPPLLLPEQIQAILDGCAVYDAESGSWRGNLRDRFVFALLAETGMRLGEALGLRIGEFVLGRGGTAYVEIVPRLDNPNGARVKMMRPRRVYVGADLERLFCRLSHRHRLPGSRIRNRLDGRISAVGERGPTTATGCSAGDDGPGESGHAASALHRAARVDATLVPPYPCHRTVARRDTGMGGIAAPWSCPRADHPRSLRLGS